MGNYNVAAISGQIAIGLINGSFYAMMSLGLAVIFGLLKISNFAHGAQFMMGAFCALMLKKYLGIDYWAALVLSPVIIGVIGMIFERIFLRRLYHLDHLYGMLVTFGFALMVQGFFLFEYGSSGSSYAPPAAFDGGIDIGIMYLPTYRLWVIVGSAVFCLLTWAVIEKTKIGSYLRAATENPALLRTFGVNVPVLLTSTYGAGVGLAALAGVMAAPVYQVSPLMGADLVILVFAVVVVGGMGSIMGAVATGFGLGLLEGLTKVVYPEASNSVIFITMALVLLFKPAGLFGKEA